MTQPTALRAFVSGVLVANSLPHIASGVAGRRHLSPLGGRRSGPVANLVWGLGNAVAGYLLLRTMPARHGQQWDSSLIAFEAGAATWATWAAGSERMWRPNHGPDAA